MSNDSDYQTSLSLKNKIKRIVTIKNIFEKNGIQLFDESFGDSGKCLCPFHNERTPSCSVDYTKGVFYCFGCKSSGDIFDFVKLKYGFKTWYDIINYFCVEYGIDTNGCETDIEGGILKSINKRYANSSEEENNLQLCKFNKDVLIVNFLLKKYSDKYNFSKECLDKLFPIYREIDKIIELTQDKNNINKCSESILLIMSNLISRV